MKNSNEAFAILMSFTKDKANQKTGIRKKEKGMRRSCIVECLINQSANYCMRNTSYHKDIIAKQDISINIWQVVFFQF